MAVFYSQCTTHLASGWRTDIDAERAALQAEIAALGDATAAKFGGRWSGTVWWLRARRRRREGAVEARKQRAGMATRHGQRAVVATALKAKDDDVRVRRTLPFNPHQTRKSAGHVAKSSGSKGEREADQRDEYQGVNVWVGASDRASRRDGHRGGDESLLA